MWAFRVFLDILKSPGCRIEWLSWILKPNEHPLPHPLLPRCRRTPGNNLNLFLCAWETLCEFCSGFNLYVCCLVKDDHSLFFFFGSLSVLHSLSFFSPLFSVISFYHLLILSFKITRSSNFKVNMILCPHVACSTSALKQTHLLSLGNETCQVILRLWKRNERFRPFAALNAHTLELLLFLK